MKKLYSTLAAIALSASGVFAAAGDKWELYELTTETKDSIETNAIYGFQTFQNKSSAVTINVGGGSINMVASKLASDGTEGWSANIGMLLPITPDWSEKDLTGLTSITFQYQNDATITDVLSVSFGSNAYTEAIAKAGTVYSNDIAGKSALAGGTTWKDGEVLISDFAPPSWWEDIPPTFPTIDSVLKVVKNLQFAPKTLYTGAGSQNGSACTKCTSPTMTAITLKVKNIVLNGVPPGKSWPNPDMVGCDEGGKSVQFDDFVTGSSKNAAGGYFFGFSDTAGADTDPAKGSSTIEDSVYEDGYLLMTAKLNKKLAGTYHKYSGWADIGTDFAKKASLNATGMTAFKFLLVDMGTNEKIIKSIIFKAKMKGVSDTAIHQVELPMTALKAAGTSGKAACIRLSDLKQADYVKGTHRFAFKPDSIVQLAWEAKITDDRQSSIDSATAVLALANIFFYGIEDFVLNKDGGTGVLAQNRVKTSVSYANGTLVLNGFVGASRFEVRDLTGKVVASFDAAKRVSFDLNRGTYLLSAKGEKVSYTSKFTVFGR